MRVFVTGGNGFIGSRVVRELHDRGHDVRCLLRPGANTERIREVPFDAVTGDMLDRSALDAGLAGSDACIHLAGPSSWAEIASDQVEPVIVDGTRLLVELASAVPGLRFVYVSSVVAVNGSDTPVVFDETARFTLQDSGLRYAVAKHRAEETVLAAAGAGLDAVVVNPAETYGPQDVEWVTAGAIRDALKGWPALAVRGGTSVTHVDDVAAGVIAALEKGRRGERYILGGDNLTVKQIVATALAAAGSRKPIAVLSPGVVRAAVRACMALHLTPPILPDLIGYASRFWFMDSAKAERELGYSFRPAEETLRSVVTWIQDARAAEKEVSSERSTQA